MVAFRPWRTVKCQSETGMSEPIRFLFRGEVRELREKLGDLWQAVSCRQLYWRAGTDL